MARPVSIDREGIVATARGMFFAKGIAATEMKDIAAACGIGRSSLYRYFESKESIAFEVAGDVLKWMGEYLNTRVTDEGNGYQRLAASLTAFVAALKENTDKVRFLDDFDCYFTDSYPDIQTAVAYSEMIKNRYIGFVDILEQGARDGSLVLRQDAQFTCLYMVNLLLGVAERILPRAGIIRQEQGYAEEYLDAALALLLDSVRVQET